MDIDQLALKTSLEVIGPYTGSEKVKIICDALWQVARECAELVERTAVSKKGPHCEGEDDGQETLKCAASAIRVRFGSK